MVSPPVMDAIVHILDEAQSLVSGTLNGLVEESTFGEFVNQILPIQSICEVEESTKGLINSRSILYGACHCHKRFHRYLRMNGLPSTDEGIYPERVHLGGFRTQVFLCHLRVPSEPASLAKCPFKFQSLPDLQSPLKIKKLASQVGKLLEKPKLAHSLLFVF